MTTRAIDVRRIAALGALALVSPAVVFFAAALGRSLQPVQHEPARTLDGIFQAFAALPSAVAVALVVVAPLVALGLALFALVRTFRSDDRLREDLRVAGRALVPIAGRPIFVISVVVFVASAAILAFLAVHAIVG